MKNLFTQRVQYDTNILADYVMYYIPKFMTAKTIAKIRVNNMEIAVKIIKKGNDRMIDISQYFEICPKVKHGIISIWVDRKV